MINVLFCVALLYLMNNIVSEMQEINAEYEKGLPQKQNAYKRQPPFQNEIVPVLRTLLPPGRIHF